MSSENALHSVSTRVYTRPEVSIVIPLYNEEEVVLQTARRLEGVLRTCCSSFELVFVDDGSTDRSLELLLNIAKTKSHIAIVSLSRNFGKELAMTAGLEHCQGDAVIVIDADLQDPPELIPDMLTHWKNGYDIVTMRRRKRDGESWLKKVSAWGYYRLLNSISDVEIPSETGDFRLLSRRAVDALAELGETQRYMKGLFAWIGYPKIEMLYDREPRYAGVTKWSYLKLWRLAIDGITSFSIAPLRLASYLGMTTALSALAYSVFSLTKTMFYGDPVQGFPTLIIVISFLGGIQLLTIGILGEYIGRLFMENKRRPKYLVQQYRQSSLTDSAIKLSSTSGS